MAPYAATKKNAQNSYSCTNDGSRGRRDESHRDTCACIAAWGGVECPMNQNRTGPEPLVAVPGQLRCVLGGVLLSRTLAGAVPSALSGLASGFGMDAGRFPVAVTTETTTWTVLLTVISGAVIRLSVWPPTPTHMRVWLVVGLGVDRIVDASLYCGCSPPGITTHARCVACVVWGCCRLCWPISTSQLTDRYRSSTPGLSTQ